MSRTDRFMRTWSCISTYTHIWNQACQVAPWPWFTGLQILGKGEKRAGGGTFQRVSLQKVFFTFARLYEEGLQSRDCPSFEKNMMGGRGERAEDIFLALGGKQLFCFFSGEKRKTW